jgi:hypothetical protein
MVKHLDALRKAFSWGRKKPDIGEIKSQLRILAKQLGRQRNRLEKEERESKSRAVQARKAGHGDAYKTYATEMIRFRRFALSVDRSRLQILKILAHVERAQTSAKTSKALEEVGKILGMLGDASDATKVVENADEIARRLEEFEIETGITEEAFAASDRPITSDDLTAAMREIDTEAGLAEASTTITPASDTDALEEDIKELEKELGI